MSNVPIVYRIDDIKKALLNAEIVYIKDLAGADWNEYPMYFKTAKEMEQRGLVKTCYDWRISRNYIITLPEVCKTCERLKRCTNQPDGKKQDKRDCEVYRTSKEEEISNNLSEL